MIQTILGMILTMIIKIIMTMVIINAEKEKTDDDGNPWFDADNCSEESGSSGGSSSECR